jgi:hypothetical protein
MKPRKNPREVNPYDLSERGGFYRRCSKCGKKKRKNPREVNPYDLQIGGFKEYCKCKN